MGQDARPINLRCSALLLRQDRLLLCERATEWVLPGGTPEPGESVAACVRREVREETGLAVTARSVAFVLDATNPEFDQHLVEVVLYTLGDDPDAEPRGVEGGLVPRFVRLDRLRHLELRPPIGGYLRAFHAGGARRTAPYLGNMWRPASTESGRAR